MTVSAKKAVFVSDLSFQNNTFAEGAEKTKLGNFPDLKAAIAEVTKHVQEINGAGLLLTTASGNQNKEEKHRVIVVNDNDDVMTPEEASRHVKSLFDSAERCVERDRERTRELGTSEGMNPDSYYRWADMNDRERQRYEDEAFALKRAVEQNGRADYFIRMKRSWDKPAEFGRITQNDTVVNKETRETVLDGITGKRISPEANVPA